VGLGSVWRRQCTGSLLRSWDRCDEHAVGLSILPYEEIVAAAEGPGGERGEGRSVGFDGDADVKGIGFEHGRRSMVSIQSAGGDF
jgi:hypothetical protein